LAEWISTVFARCSLFSTSDFKVVFWLPTWRLLQPRG